MRLHCLLFCYSAYGQAPVAASQVQGILHPVTVKPQVLQKSLQRTCCNTPGAQLVPQESSQRFRLQIATWSPIAA